MNQPLTLDALNALIRAGWRWDGHCCRVAAGWLVGLERNRETRIEVVDGRCVEDDAQIEMKLEEA